MLCSLATVTNHVRACALPRATPFRSFDRWQAIFALALLEEGANQFGRITKTVRSRFRNIAKKSKSCFQGAYFLFSSCMPCCASAPARISARAGTHSPFNPPRMSQGATFTRGLLRMRFTFPETPIVYTYSFASFESSFAEGSAANHTGVFTPWPLFLKVSRFRYLCPAKAANPIAPSLCRAVKTRPLFRCGAFYTGHKHKGQAL